MPFARTGLLPLNPEMTLTLLKVDEELQALQNAFIRTESEARLQRAFTHIANLRHRGLFYLDDDAHQIAYSIADTLIIEGGHPYECSHLFPQTLNALGAFYLAVAPVATREWIMTATHRYVQLYNDFGLVHFEEDMMRFVSTMQGLLLKAQPAKRR